MQVDKFNLRDFNKEILGEYQIYLLTEQHLLDNSISSYVMDVYKYLEYMEDKGISSCFKIKKDDLIEYLGYLDKEDYSIYSVVRKISSLRSFHYYLYKNYQIEDISEYIKNPRFYRKLPNVLSIEEVDMLLDMPLRDEFDYRNKAMIELMYATGLRVSELVNLSISNEGYGVMRIEEYQVPIKVNGYNIKQLGLENKYYLNVKEGITYDKYVCDTIYDSNIILPYIDKEYSVNIELYDCFLSFNTVSVSFVVATSNSLLGDCSSSVYCFRRVYL